MAQDEPLFPHMGGPGKTSMLKVETTKATIFYVDKKTGVGAAEYSKYEMRLSICE